ncbi:zinc finger protein 93-like [Littorina saxatilis]|uniref:zinc finger protein 93-like n=1 Tax=Littorina saxatilis TaxID=31220 RepID=UPI0038B58BD5
MASASPGSFQEQHTSTGMMERPEKKSPATCSPLQCQSPNSFEPQQRNQKPFQCGLCSVTFDINVELVTHVHRHSLTKPYQCGYCNVSYDDNPALIVHVQTHALFMVHLSANAARGNADQMLHLFADTKSSGSSSVAERKEVTGSQDTPFHLVDCDVSSKEDSTNSDNEAVMKALRSAQSTVQQIGSEMVVENPVPLLLHKNKIKPEMMSDGESEEVDTCSETKPATKKMNEGKMVEENQGKKRDSKKPFSCDICGSTFKAARYVKDHERRVHKMLPAQPHHKSELFQASDKRESDLMASKSKRSIPERRSKRKVRQIISTEISSDFSDAETSLVTDKVKVTDGSNLTDAQDSFECSDCGKVLKSWRTLKRHKVFVHTDSRPFPCTQCSLRFKAKNTLKDHISFVHTDERPFPCTQCSLRFKTKVQLSTHIRCKHTDERPFPCPHCSKCFKTKETMKDHVSFVHLNERPFPCSQCSLRCKTKVHLNRHIRSKHLNEKPFQCAHCSTRFKQKTSLSAHILSKHSSSKETTDCDNTSDKPYQCKYCSASFKVEGTLSAHVLIKHKDMDNDCGDRPFACPHCPWKFKGNFALTSHIARVHENQRPFPCLQCTMSFKSKDELSSHVNRRHNTETPHQCTDCGRCFKIKSALNQHFCKPKECPICGHMLNCLSSYEHHMKRKHSQDSFKCSTCDMGFLSERELEVHTRTHTKEKPFTCEFCGQSFGRLIYLTYHRNGRHLNTRPYKCDICHKGFNSHPSLWQHKRRHLGDKKYSCDQCGKKFYQSSTMKEHALTHTDLRSYACSVCGKTYRSRGNLYYHVKHSHQN